MSKPLMYTFFAPPNEPGLKLTGRLRTKVVGLKKRVAPAGTEQRFVLRGWPIGTGPISAVGVVADTFWRQPGVARSDNPHAFAACGAMADRITSPHPVVVPHGLDSPVGRVLDLDGWVLLVGIGHEANTTIHLAEVLERAVYSLPVRSTLRERGRVRRVYYAEVGGCSERFALLDGPLEASGAQRRGLVGHATARLVRARDVVDAAREAMQADPFVFLHAPGACDTCDQASAWIPHHLRKAQRGEAIDDPRRDVTAP